VAYKRCQYHTEINGRIFHVNSDHETKAAAREQAEWIRGKGHRARVMHRRNCDGKMKWQTLMS
jgi:hypothetical protein